MRAAQPPIAARLVLAVLVLWVLSGCRADLTTTVTVELDGSGVVEVEVLFDEEATAALLDLGVDGPGLVLSDLAQAGWEVDPPLDQDGKTLATAEKSFGNMEQFSEVMADLSGPDGVFQDFALTEEQAFGQLDYFLSGTIDPTVGIDSFGDDDLQSSLGRSLSQLATDKRFQVTPADFSVALDVKMPGEPQVGTELGADFVEGQDQVTGHWETSMAGVNPVEVELNTTRQSTRAQVLRGVAVVAGVLAVLIAFAQLLRVLTTYQRRSPQAKPSTQLVDAKGEMLVQDDQAFQPDAEHSIAEGQSEDETESFGHRVIALDGMGVLYKHGNDIRDLLVPFARERGSRVAADEIAVKARQLSLGRISTREFWSAIAVEGDPDELDTDYVARHQLMPGVVKYLRSLRDADIRIACVTNDAATWATKLRASHSLEGLIDPWVVSGSVGIRKPEQAIFEVLRRVTGESPESILIVDDDLDTLDVARELGFATTWFSEDGERADGRDHPIRRSFAVADEDEPSPESTTAPA